MVSDVCRRRLSSSFWYYTVVLILVGSAQMIRKICCVTTICDTNITNTTLNSGFVYNGSTFIRFKTKKLSHFTLSTWKGDKTTSLGSHFEHVYVQVCMRSESIYKNKIIVIVIEYIILIVLQYR